METPKHIDLTYLKELSNGSNEFMLQMINLFIATMPQMVADLETYLIAENWPSIRTTAHKMKPSVSFMGLKEIETDIALLESYAAEKVHLDRLPEMISKIKAISFLGIAELELQKKCFS